MQYDILIKNAKIIDGTGNPWFYGDVGVVGDETKKLCLTWVRHNNVFIKKQGGEGS